LRNMNDSAHLYIITKTSCLHPIVEAPRGSSNNLEFTKSFTFFHDRKWTWPSESFRDLQPNCGSRKYLKVISLCSALSGNII
jgi:hypothetical protein